MKDMLRRVLVWVALLTSSISGVASGDTPDTPTTLQLASGIGGRMFYPDGTTPYDPRTITRANANDLRNVGPGNEQPDVTTLIKDGDRYVVSVYMSSKGNAELG